MDGRRRSRRRGRTAANVPIGPVCGRNTCRFRPGGRARASTPRHAGVDSHSAPNGRRSPRSRGSGCRDLGVVSCGGRNQSRRNRSLPRGPAHVVYSLRSACMGRNGDHAVVIGASIGGLCAARVLSDFYDRVTVYERDELPAGPANRSAVPQGRHVHLLMARGAAGVRRAFPGSARRHGRRGRADSGEPARLHPLRRRRPRARYVTPLRDEFTAYVPSRPQLEWQIRRRVSAIPNVDIVRAGIAEPTFDAARQRVTGVQLDTGDAVPADLVVDAAGRGTRLPVWLEQWGFDRPTRTASTSASATPHISCASPRD